MYIARITTKNQRADFVGIFSTGEEAASVVALKLANREDIKIYPNDDENNDDVGISRIYPGNDNSDENVERLKACRTSILNNSLTIDALLELVNYHCDTNNRHRWDYSIEYYSVDNLPSMSDYIVQFDVAQLKELAKKRGWTKHDVCESDALDTAVGYGKLDVVVWLVTRFELTVEDVRKCSALKTGITYKEYETVAWLVYEFSLDDDYKEVQYIDKDTIDAIEEELKKLRGNKMVKAAVHDRSGE